MYVQKFEKIVQVVVHEVVQIVVHFLNVCCTLFQSLLYIFYCTILSNSLYKMMPKVVHLVHNHVSVNIFGNYSPWLILFTYAENAFSSDSLSHVELPRPICCNKVFESCQAHHVATLRAWRLYLFRVFAMLNSVNTLV